MPAGDRTGPTGSGPMTGRGAGFCAGFNAPGFTGAGRGGFGGFGRGGYRAGMGRRNRFFAGGRPFFGRRFQAGADTGQYSQYEYSPEAELRMLKEQAEFINERIKNLESAAQTEK